MASFITAGNATNGLQVSSDNTGILQLKTGTGAGTTAVTVDASQNTTLAGTLAVGAVTSTGLVTGATGALYPITVSTPVATTSGTSVDITGVIPSWAKRVTLLFNGVSTSGTVDMLIQLGTSAGIETTGYISQGSTTGNNPTTSTAGFVIYVASALHTFYGSVVFNLFQGSTNTWVGAGLLGQSTNGSTHTTQGVKPLAGTLDRIRLTTLTAVSTFDAGSINILYE